MIVGMLNKLTTSNKIMDECFFGISLISGISHIYASGMFVGCSVSENFSNQILECVCRNIIMKYLNSISEEILIINLLEY